MLKKISFSVKSSVYDNYYTYIVMLKKSFCCLENKGEKWRASWIVTDEIFDENLIVLAMCPREVVVVNFYLINIFLTQQQTSYCIYTAQNRDEEKKSTMKFKWNKIWLTASLNQHIIDQ